MIYVYCALSFFLGCLLTQWLHGVYVWLVLDEAAAEKEVIVTSRGVYKVERCLTYRNTR